MDFVCIWLGFSRVCKTLICVYC